MNKQILIIMRGPSGGGKSTKSAELAIQYNAVIYSTDEYHYIDGKYEFQPTKLGLFHNLNQKRTIKALQEGKSVIVDNTNLTMRDVKPYVKAAHDLGIEIMFVVCNGEYKNLHGVPEEKVLEMRKRMQDFTVEDVLASIANEGK
jgi:predicted kinase